MLNFSIISAFPPGQNSGASVHGSAEVLISDCPILIAEDYNKETQKTYRQAELYGVKNAKIRVTVVGTKKGGVCLVGALTPPYDDGVKIAEAIVARIEAKATDAA